MANASSPGMKGLSDTLNKLKKQTAANSVHTNQVKMAISKGKINHREASIEKYNKNPEYKSTWKSIDPDRLNRLKREIGDENNKFNIAESIVGMAGKDAKKGKNELAKEEIEKLKLDRKNIKKKRDTFLCKAKESKRAKPKFAAIKMDCRGKPKRAFFDKTADDRIKGDFYKADNKVSEIDFKIKELEKINKKPKKGDKKGDKKEEGVKKEAMSSSSATDPTKLLSAGKKLMNSPAGKAITGDIGKMVSNIIK